MDEKRKCNCEFCKLHALRTKALESDDIEFVKKTLKEFADLWLFVSEDLSYYKCIMDGSWPTADVLLTDALEKFKNHPNRELENG
jgi:hypothetical protein